LGQGPGISTFHEECRQRFRRFVQRLVGALEPVRIVRLRIERRPDFSRGAEDRSFSTGSSSGPIIAKAASTAGSNSSLFSLASVQIRSFMSSKAWSTDSVIIRSTAASSTSTAALAISSTRSVFVRVSRARMRRIPLASISKLDADPRAALRSRLKIQGKLAEIPVVASQFPFALEDPDEHGRLIGHRVGEEFTGLGGDRRVARDDHVHQPAEGFDPEGERRHIKEH